MDYKISWTEEAIRNLEEIINYLLTHWTQREVDNFKAALAKQIDQIKKIPKCSRSLHISQDSEGLF